MRWTWTLALLPLSLGLLVTLLVQLGLVDNVIVYLRADLSIFAILVGSLISGWLLGTLISLHRKDRHWQQTHQQARAIALEDRRRFLRRLDHELKNPLTALEAGIANIADQIQEQHVQMILATLQAQTRRLGKLTSDLRKLTELETRPFDASPVDLTNLLRELIVHARDHPLASERQFSLSMPHVPWPLPSIIGDHDLLFAAFYNLVENALKFTDPGATIELRAFEDGKSVVIEIADTGAGIAPEELELVWEELYRGQSTRSVPGSGLGLALVRAIIARHHGDVALRSRVGTGTVATVRLPVD